MTITYIYFTNVGPVDLIFILDHILLYTFGPLSASIILVAIVACIDKCSCCSCSCCCDYCLPMTERIPNTFGKQNKEVMYKQENVEIIAMEDIEMSSSQMTSQESEEKVTDV